MAMQSAAVSGTASIIDFSLRGTDGRTYTLADVKGKNGTVAVMSNDTVAYPSDSFDNMKVFAKEHRFAFPYVIDETQKIARAYGAVCTPDLFGFNAHGNLEYRG